MSSASSSGAQFLTSCYFMQCDGSQPPDEKLQVTGKSITYNYYRKENDPRQEYPFDIVYNNHQAYAKTAYLSVVAPLVKKAAHGDSTMIIFGGLQSLNLNNYALSQTSMQGMVSQAAGQLLHAINSQSEKLGSVTFSWYTIDCQSEVLTDILQGASMKPSTSGKDGNSTNNLNNNNKETLVFRDMGRGRNMAVQGLLELEITSGQDIETVMQHVTQLLPQANHRSGHVHTVMQLIINNPGKARQYKPPVTTGSAGIGTAAAGATAVSGENQFGAGRVTFLCLGSMAASHSQFLPGRTSEDSADTPTSPTGTRSFFFGSGEDIDDKEEIKSQQQQKERYVWPNQVQEILTWLDHRRAAPPFHRSRLLLLLREVFMRRQHAAMMLLLQPTAQTHQVNRMWLQFASDFHQHKLNNLPNSTSSSNVNIGNNTSMTAGSSLLLSSSSINVNTPSNKQQLQPNAGRTPVIAPSRSLSRTRGMTTGTAATNNNISINNMSMQINNSTSKLRSAPNSRSASPAPAKPSPASNNTTNNTPYYLIQHQQRQQQQVNSQKQEDDHFFGTDDPHFDNNDNNNNYVYGEDMQPLTPASHGQMVDKKLEGENLLLRTLHGGGASTNNMNTNTNAMNSVVSSPPPPPPPPPPVHATASASFRTPQQTGALSRRAQSMHNMGSATGNMSSNNSVSNHTATVTANATEANRTGIAYAEDFAHSESEAALSLALEASRNEAAALRIAYQYAQEKYKETQAQLDTLLSQLKEEGATLRARDKERLKHAIRDVKDYQIYKQVMETAMVKLQLQLENVVKQNEELRVNKIQEERTSQRQRSFSEKYSKDLVATKRKLSELENQVIKLDKQNKLLQREKEAAVSHLAQLSSSSSQKTASLQEVLSLRQREVDDLTIRVKIAEEKNLHLEQEKQALLQQTTKEMEILRAAHAKALETLMSYQEENDTLRATIFDLTGSHFISNGNSRNTGHNTSNDGKPSNSANVPAGVNLQAIQSKMQHRHPLAGQRALSMDESTHSEVSDT